MNGGTNTMTASSTIAEQEKSNAAATSVIAAVGLTTFKIIVGLMTNSLGILAEAAHSGLDLVAALVTFLPVRISGKPADSQHTYDHGKIETCPRFSRLCCYWPPASGSSLKPSSDCSLPPGLKSNHPSGP